MVSCHNGELDTSKYSSPMPAVGLYIAIATLVCLVSITFDLWYGLVRRKFHWLPSKLFALNSFTLTIISAATKLAVDLNTPMPRPIDQFSKLTSTVFLCVSLGLFVPTVGSVSASDRIANLAALSIIAITTIVNIVIQLFTGVIFSFFLEHLIIVSCMLLLLLLLWSSSTKLTAVKYFSNLEELPSISSISDMEKEVRGFHRHLNVEYPLRYLFRNPNSSTAGALCSVTTAVLLEAAVRTISGWESRFCNGISDYQWSIWLVVIAQLLTILIGTITVVYRWIMVVNQTSLGWSPILKKIYKFNNNWTFRIREWRYTPIPFDLHNQTIMSAIKKFKDLFTWVLMKLQRLVIWTGQLVECLCLMVRWPLSFALRNYEVEDPKVEPGDEDWNWIRSLIMADMERWIKLNDRPGFTNLNNLLSKKFSQSGEPHSLLRKIQRTGWEFKKHKYEISSLSLVVLTRIAASSLPSRLSDFLFRCLKEAIEIISFIEEKFNSKCFGYESKLMRMNVIYEYLHNPKFEDMTRGGEEDNLDSCLAKIKRAPDTLFKFKRESDVQFIVKSIQSREYESIDHLYDCIERTFQEMVIYLMADLPRAILMEYYDCPLEEIEERTRRALKFFCQLKLLGDKIQWSWPKQRNFFSLPKRMCNDSRVREFVEEKKTYKQIL